MATIKGYSNESGGAGVIGQSNGVLGVSTAIGHTLISSKEV